MLPIHIIRAPKEAKDSPALPEDNLCLLIGSNGVFKQTCNEFYHVISKVDDNVKTGLALMVPKTRLFVHKLPFVFIREAGAFFTAVYRQQQSEAVVMLYCHPKHGWHMDAPLQSAVGLHVDYDLTNLSTSVKGYVITSTVEYEKDGRTVTEVQERVSQEPDVKEGERVTDEFEYRLFGTIHSHASASAFHSGTDDKDEKQFDGLHITIGNVDVPSHSYSARWVLDGKFYKSEMKDVAEEPPESFFDNRWLKRVTKKSYTNSYAGGVGGGQYGASSHLPHNPQYPHMGGRYPYEDGFSDWWPDGPGVGRGEGGDTRAGATFPSSTTSQGEKRKFIILAEGARAEKTVEATTPEEETRLRLLVSFTGLQSPQQQLALFERLERKWKDNLIKDLVMWYPIRSAAFLQGVGVVLQRNTNGGSDASSTSAAEQIKSTTSRGHLPSTEHLNRTIGPPTALVNKELPAPTSPSQATNQPGAPREVDYTETYFE